MRVIVVGATGNVGTSVVSALASDERVGSVIGLARRPRGPALPGVEWQACDIRMDDLAARFQGADAVIHLAWVVQPSHDERHMRRTNVDGSRRVFDAVAASGATALIYASSVGAYAPGPKDRLVGESWPTTGIASSFYSRHKAEVEAILNRFQIEHPSVRVVRLRPGLIFKRGAASEIKRYFLGRLVPSRLVRAGAVPFVPALPGLRFQAVHADDIAAAYRLAATGEAEGPFNIAADPVVGPAELAKLLDAQTVRVPRRPARALLAAAWRARLQPTEPGWLDMALQVPLMDTTRAHEALGWTPTASSLDALREVLVGIPRRAGESTPVLRP